MKTSFATATFLLVVGRTAAAPLLSSLSLECERLVSCLTEMTKLPVMDDIFGAVGLESASTDDICHDFVLLFGGETGVDAICGAADAMMHTGSTMTSANGQFQATCSSGTPKDPEYPSGSGYELLTAALLNLYLFEGRQARSDANAYSQLFIGTIAARAAQAAATACDSDVLVILTGGLCLAAKVAAEAAVVATEATVESLNIQDGLIDAAEIQAAYLNTETIISQNCGIEGSIANLQTDIEDFRLEAVERFDIVDDSIANLQTDIDLDSLKLSIEPTDDTAMNFLILSTERGVEKGIDLVIDCFDEADEMYQTQPFTRTEISEGTTLVKFLSPKSEKKSKKSGKGKGKGGSKISRFKGTTKKVVSRSGVRSVRTVIRRTD